MLGSALEDFDQRINQRVLASTVVQKEHHSRLQQETVESLKEFQDHLRGNAETVFQEVLAGLPGEIERNRTEAVARITSTAEETLNAAIRRFEQKLESLTSETQETAKERMRAETLASLAPELEACRSKTIDQTQNEVKQTLQAALSEFEQRLQTTAAQTQESVAERLKAETLSKLLPELVTRQVEAIDQARERVRQTVEASLSDFQQRLQATATQTQDATAERLRQETLAKLTPEFEARQAQVLGQVQNQAQQTLQAALSEFEERLQTTAAQTQQSASEQLRVETLAKLAPELEARQAQVIGQTQIQVKQTLEAALGEFEQRLQTTAAQTQQSASEQLRVETLAKLAPELEARQAEVIGQAQNQVQHTLDAALREFEQRLQTTAAQTQQSASEQLRAETLAQLAPELEAHQAEVIGQTQNQVKQTLDAALSEFEQRLQTTAIQTQESVSGRLSEEILGRLTPQIEVRHSEALQQTNDQVKQDLSSALSFFQKELRTASTEVRQASMEQLNAEMAVGLGAQLETRQLEAVEQTKRQIANELQTSFGEFEQRLQAAAAQTEQAAIEKLRADFFNNLTPELHACQAGTVEQTRGQIQQSLEAGVGEFREQLQLAANQAQQSATEQLIAGILTCLVPQLEARQAETLEATRDRVQQTLENSLGEFNGRLEIAAAQAGETASERLTAQILRQLLPEIEIRQNAAVIETQKRVEESLKAGLGSFEQTLQCAAEKAQQAALDKLASESQLTLAPVLEAQRSEVLDRIHHQVGAEIEVSVRSLREHLAHEVTACQKSADSLLQKPSELIRKYAEDTMSMLREEMIEQRNSAVESAKLEVRAMLRSTLTSLNEEASAFTGEFREQIKSVWEGMKSRGLEELDSLHKEAMEQRRESVLERLQKDAEDLTHVAVGQFRSQSEEAIHEANSAINKQVGAAAFLLKDWMDQATTRLEHCLEKVETRAETAFEAAQARSLKMQMAMMERVQRESEEIALELHDRFQQAASALRRSQTRVVDEVAQSGGPGEEHKVAPAPSILER